MEGGSEESADDNSLGALLLLALHNRGVSDLRAFAAHASSASGFPCDFLPASSTMHARNVLALALSMPLTQAAETILGLYIFSRHGDRTAKATPPTVLTDLGYREVFDSGTWFRENYIVGGSPKQIAGIETDLVKYSQLAVSAPLDTVLMPSAQGFMQGMYPPVGPTLGSIQLRNKTTVEAPLNGYQIIPIQQVTSGTGSEDQAWLQGSSNCNNAVLSSNEYFMSPEYMALLNSTKDFYQNNILPSVNATFNSTKTTFFNAYSRMSTNSYFLLFSLTF